MACAAAGAITAVVCGSGLDLARVDLLAQRQYRVHPVVEQLDLLFQPRITDRQRGRRFADRPVVLVGDAAHPVELGAVAAAGDELARCPAFARMARPPKRAVASARRSTEEARSRSL